MPSGLEASWQLRLRLHDTPIQFECLDIPKAMMKQHSDGSSDVIVAGPRRSQAVRRVRQEFVPRTTRNHAEPFKSARNTATCEAVITVLALNDYLDELCRPESMQVNAGCGGADATGDRKLSARTCMAIQKRKEHARPRRLTNGGSNTGDCDVGWVVNKHGFMLSEVLLFANWHYSPYGFLAKLDLAITRMRSSPGLAGRTRGADD